MALFHLNVKQIKRSQGQSAIASAAYRAGEKLSSEYYGEIADYTHKGGVICSEILLPDHVPREYADRETLWNAVEKVERGTKAQLAYSFDVALQNEFSMDENIALARQFLMEHFVSRGMIVDFAVHLPDKDDGGIENPHFHIMAPIRPIEGNGRWGNKQKREYVLDEHGNRIPDGKGDYVFNAVPTTDWGSPDTLEFWREQWANLCNAKFEEKGLPVRIDHRSYERQGLDILPTIHEGPTVRAMEKKGIRTEKSEFNHWIKATNNAIHEIKKTIIALMDWLKEAKEELSKPKAPGLIELFQAYYTQRNANAYSQRAKANNLKEMSELFNYMKANCIYDLETLESRVDALHTTLDELKATMDSKSKQIKELQKLSQYLGAYKELKPVADGLKKIKFDKAKEKYKVEHADELKRFYEARRKITARFPDGKYDSRVLDEEIVKLEEEYFAAYEQFKAVRSDSQILWKIKSHVDTARQNMERKQEQINRKRQEQEL